MGGPGARPCANAARGTADNLVSLPLPIAITAVACGQYHTAVLAEGLLYVFGGNAQRPAPPPCSLSLGEPHCVLLCANCLIVSLCLQPPWCDANDRYFWMALEHD